LTRPFEGVKILDFTQVLAGPYASYQLALLGADVIKVERREGEDMRRTPLSREWAERGLAPGWQAINGNKRSLTLDLSRPEAITIVKQLAVQADVVMENFRPGVMDKFGIGYAALSAINPRLIYCAISGFGQTGPARLGAGYDGKIQALSGIMSITGHAETGPTRAGFAVCDVLSGSTAAFGVSSALFQRWRRRWRSCRGRWRTTRWPVIASNCPATRRSAAGRPPICLGRGRAICCSPSTARSNTSR
jgi:crotonobetainyl-CoA:carnitine CoA-transferase CaiB-like acyl-CoA transferase